MRITLFLVLVALVVGCGGDNPYDQKNATGDQGANAANGEAATPDKPERPPMSPETRELLLAVKAANGAPDSKKSALEKLPAWEGRDVPPDASYYLGLLHRFAENHEKAVTAFEKFVRMAPEDTNRKTGIYYLVEELVALGRLEEAEKYTSQFEQEFTDAESAKYARSLETTLAAAFAGGANFGKSTAHYGKAMELGSYFDGEEYVMGLWAQGKYDEARTAAGKLKDLADGQKELERASHFVSLAGKMGKPAPKLDVEAWVNPEGFDPSKLAGKVVLVYFWTTGQQNSAMKTERALKAIWDTHAGDDFQIVGISKHDKYSVIDRTIHDDWGTEEEVHNLKLWAQNSSMWLGEGNLTPWHLALVANTSLRDAFGYANINPTIAIIGKDGKYRYFRQSEGWSQIGALVGELIKE